MKQSLQLYLTNGWHGLLTMCDVFSTGSPVSVKLTFWPFKGSWYWLKNHDTVKFGGQIFLSCIFEVALVFFFLTKYTHLYQPIFLLPAMSPHSFVSRQSSLGNCFLQHSLRTGCWDSRHFWTTHNWEVKYWIQWACFKKVFISTAPKLVYLAFLQTTLFFFCSGVTTRYHIWCQSLWHLRRSVKIFEPHLNNT